MQTTADTSVAIEVSFAAPLQYHFVIAVWRAKEPESAARVKYWEIIANNLSKAGWSWGCVSAVDSRGRTIFIADAHRGDAERFVVRADEKLAVFLELESTFSELIPEGGGRIAPRRNRLAIGNSN